MTFPLPSRQLLAVSSPGERADEVTAALCAEHGVLILFSPPYTPSYSGSCKAGVGSVKSRAARIATAIDESGVEQKLPLSRHVRSITGCRAIPQVLAELGRLEVRRC